jgi:hypothetical protein
MKIIEDIKDLKDTDFNEFQSRNAFGSTDYKSQYLSAANLAGGRIGKDSIIELGNKLVRLNSKEGRLEGSDGKDFRWMLGRRPDGTFGWDVSEDGVNVFEASLSELVGSDRIIPVSYKWSTFVESSNQETGNAATVGWVSYADNVATAHNKIVRIDFFTESNLTIKDAVIRVKYFDYFDGATGTLQRLDDVSVYLDPTKTNTTATGGTGFKFWRFSTGSGALLQDKYDPGSDEITTSITLSAAQIALITANSWHNIVVQQQTNDSDENNSGFVSLDFFVIGYLTS